MFEDLFWFDPFNYSFHRPMYESKGYYAIEKDGKIYLLVNVLGVEEKDVSVDVVPSDKYKQILRVSGNTHDSLFDKNFDVKMEFGFSKELESAEYTIKNGFMTIEVSFKEPAKPSVKIVKK